MNLNVKLIIYEIYFNLKKNLRSIQFKSDKLNSELENSPLSYANQKNGAKKREFKNWIRLRIINYKIETAASVWLAIIQYVSSFWKIIKSKEKVFLQAKNYLEFKSPLDEAKRKG